MKKVMMFLVVLVATAPVFAGMDLNVGNVIKLSDQEGDNGGGEFGVALASAPALELFRTFCVEKNEYLNFGGTFNVDAINTAAVMGGVAGGSPDPLSFKTAYLYSKFRAGALTAGYDYTPGSTQHIADATELQQAIWFYEEEITLSASAQLANKYIQEANGSGWTDLGNVRVANLSWVTGGGATYPAGTLAQDILVLVPAPGAALLALIGLPIVGWFKRRLV